MTIAAERRSSSSNPSTDRPRWPALSYLARFEWAAAARPRHRLRGAPAKRRALAVAGGVVLPLLAGVLAGRTVEGVFAALGALLAGLASFQGVSRTRMSAVAVAGLGAAVSTFVGATVAAAQPWALIPVISLWGYVAGLAVSLGQRRGAVATLWSAALLIAIGMPLDPARAASRAGFVLAGTALQAGMVALSWAARRGGHERAAMAASYRDLAEYADCVARGTHQAPAPAAFPAAARVADPNPLLPTATRGTYAALLERAEQIRAALASVAQHGGEDPAARRLAAETARVLGGVAETLAARPRAAVVRSLPAPLLSGSSRARAAVVRLSPWFLPSAAPRARAAVVPSLPALPQPDADWHWAAAALLSHLRSVTELLGSDSPVPTAAAGAAETDAPALRTLRAHLNPSGEVGRHALRLAAAGGIAEAFVRITGLYEGRWMVLTVFLVLKPDYTSTVSRGVHRALGTAAGAILGAVIATVLHGAPVGLVLAAGIAVAAAYAVFEIDYLMYSLYLTVFIVLLLDLLGISAETGASVRLADTALGALLALIAYAAWPTWHGRTAQGIFARLVEAHRGYVAALRFELGAAGGADAHRLRALQSAARRARTDAEAAVARLAAEPPHPPLTADAARALVATAARLARAELSLHTLLTSPAYDPGRAAALAAATEAALADLAEESSGLRTGVRPRR